MWNIITTQALDFFDTASNKCILIASTLAGFILTAIGFPKQVLSFIIVLIIADTITKHYSIVVINYKEFSISNYLKAWKDRCLSSRGMKNGWGVKALLYLPILFFAHQASIVPELIGGTVISNIIYSMLLIIELRSILENFEDAGVTGLSRWINILNKREKQILKDNGFEEDETDTNEGDDANA